MTTHIVPLKTYLAVFGGLILLTTATTGADYIDLGRWNLILALGIATAKALLVVLYFMHLRYSGGLIRVFVGAAIMWLMILIGMTLDDVLTRGWQFRPRGW